MPLTRPVLTPAIRLLTAGAAVLAISLAIRHGFGLFMAPVSETLAIGRETFGFAIAVQNLVWGIAQPFAGALADRLGAHRVVLAGGFLYAAGLWLMALSDSALMLILSTGVVLGLALSGTSFPVVFGAIARALPVQRHSVAMGIAMAIGALGQFLMLPAAATMIGDLGWVGTLLALSVLAALMMPLSLGLREARVASKDEVGVSTDRTTAIDALRTAVSTPGFWLLSLGFSVCGFHVVFVATHLPAHLADHGFSPSVAAIALSLIGLFNVIGAYAAGHWGGRNSKPRLLAGIFLARTLVFGLFVLTPLSTASVMLFSASMGLLWLSTVPLTNGTVASIFGTTHLSMLGGVVFLFHQLGAFAGGWLGGAVVEASGSYDLMWWLCAALALVAALIHLPIREVPLATHRQAPATGD